jgi:cephalosporin hydroxylase
MHSARAGIGTVRHIARDIRERKGGSLGPKDVGELAGRALVRWPPAQRAIASAYHRLIYYNPSRTWSGTRWLGHEIRKLPLDVWIYQELIHAVRPALIIETGTRFGGSAMLMAHLCDLLGHGEVVTIDVAAVAQPEHPRVTYIDGSSTDPAVVERVRSMVDGGPVMVILDSDHRESHVRDEIAAYADLVTPGSYLIVEDTNTGGNPVHNVAVPDRGPLAPVRELLARDSRFEADEACERFFVTLNPTGYLRRLR